MNILIFFIILLVLVLVHEFGHFFTAKRFGIRVDEFGFGFPPRLFGIKKGETEYTFNLLPIGGFVKIFGETPDDENMNGPDRDRSFVNKPKWQQAIVLFAGVFANFLLAWLLFSVGFMSGFPTSVGNEMKEYALRDVKLVVISVTSDSPADMGGLKSGDKIVSLESGKEMLAEVSPENIKSFVVSHTSSEITVGYIRGKGQEVNFTKITPKDNLIGISMDQIGIAKLGILESFWEGMKLSIFVTKSTAVGLFTLIYDGLRGQGDLSSVTGPVGIVGIVGDAYDFGFVYLLSLSALISINLAIINLIPFPALDGGRLFFLLIEKIKGRAMNPKVANTANMIGFGILILLMLVITYRDVVKLL